MFFNALIMQKIYQFYSDATFKDNEFAARRSQQKEGSKQTNKQKQTNIVSDWWETNLSHANIKLYN